LGVCTQEGEVTKRLGQLSNLKNSLKSGGRLTVAIIELAQMLNDQ